MIVDLHTHFFGPEFFRVLAAASSGGDPGPGYGKLRAAGLDLPRGDPEEHARRWVEELDRHGVDRAVTFASLPEEAGTVARGAASSGGRLVPFALANPAAPGAAARVEELAGLGFRGLVLFPAMHRYDPSDGRLTPFYDAAAARGLPLIVHLGTLEVRVREILGLPADFDASLARPEALRSAALAHPRLRFIIPHFGGVTFRETLDLGRQCPNVAVDTSSSNSWRERLVPPLDLPAVFRGALDAFGPRRIHFGTDSSVFPRGYRRDVLDAQRAALAGLGLPSADTARILGGNTDELLGRGPLE
jgi:hypothetical protein